MTKMLDKKAEDLTVKENLILGTVATIGFTAICFAPWGVAVLVEKVQNARARRRDNKLSVVK